MPEPVDMSHPVTHGELREELANLKLELRNEFATKVDLEKFATKADLDKFATKADLEAFITKANLTFATKVDLDTWGGALLAQFDIREQRLFTELGRHVRAIQESLSTQVSVVDEKYADLPERVTRLEDGAKGEHRR